MARGKFGETLQAIEVNQTTFIGSLKKSAEGCQIHLLEDTDVTFIFNSGKITKLDGLPAGLDLVAGPGCNTVSTTSDVIFS